MPLFLKIKKKPIILFSLIFFQLVLISLQVPLGDEQTYFEKAIFFVFSPVQHGITSFFQKIGNLWKNYFYLWNAQDQNQKMREEIFALREENSLLRYTLQNFKNEKEIEDNLSKIHQSFLIASVIGVDASNIYKSIIVNKGTLNGVKKNMVVLDKYGNLVGRVIGPISLKEARVQLITDNESGVSVLPQDKSAVGVVTGDAKGMCFLKYVLATQEISEGEEVMTSGFDSIFFSGIKVGKVVSITSDTSLFKKIIVRPYFDFGELDHVAILTLNSKEIF
jgi:rod shape-determining protein MreC